MKKIIIIEDHAGLRESYKIALEKNDYEVTLAEDGAIGLELVKNNTYDLILLDMLMPNLGGIGFLKEFNPIVHPWTKVIVFSNLDDIESMQEALKLGAVRYLTKVNVNPNEMLQYIKEDIG
ncbi:MAG: response regulator [bacterium]